MKAADQVGLFVVVHAEFPCRQADLPVLVRVESGQVGCTGLAATSLGDIGIVESHTIVSQSVQNRSTHVSVPVAAQFLTIVFGND